MDLKRGAGNESRQFRLYEFAFFLCALTKFKFRPMKT